MSVAVVALFGAVAFGLVVLAVHLWLLLSTVQTAAFVAAIKKLLLADNRERAVKLSEQVSAASADRQLVLFLVGLELPRQTLPELAPSGYRGFLPVERFEDRLGQIVTEQAPRFYRKTLRRAAAAVVGGLAGAGLAVVAHGLGRSHGPPLAELGVADAPEHVLLFGAGALLLLALFAARRSRRTLAGRRIVLQELVPLLRPLEEMSSGDRTAAAAARELLSEAAGRPGSTWRGAGGDGSFMSGG